MNKIVVVVLTILIALSAVAAYYTDDMKQQEIEKKQTISLEISEVKTQIIQTESAISQVEQENLETELLIQQEKEEQEELSNSIETLNAEEQQLKESIKTYEKIAQKDPRVLITLDDPVVKAKVEEVTRLCRTTEEKQQAIFEYVRKEIEYVTEGNPDEYSYPRSFLQFKFDFWQLPRETIEWRKGDCEDRSILLCTMMRLAGVPASNVRIVLGVIYTGGGMGGHAWIEFKIKDTWYALESTCPSCNYITRDRYYEILSPDVWGWFNDKEYHDESLTTGYLPAILTDAVPI